MAIEMNVFDGESISIVNELSASGSKWVKIIIRDVHNERHEINVIPADNKRNMAFFIGCRENEELENAA